KVKSFFQTLTKPIRKAVDWITDKIVATGKKLWTKLKSKFSKRKGNDQQGQQKKIDPRIRELVAADVNAQLPDGVADEKVKPAAMAIMAKRRSQGLHLLEVKPGNRPGRFEVYMAASPTTLVRSTQVDPGDERTRDLINGNRYPEATFNIPKDVIISGQIKLPVSGEKAGYGATYAIATLHTPTRVTAFDKTSSGDSLHAEEVLCQDLQSNWDSYVGPVTQETRPGMSKPQANLVVKVTRSPCGRCAPQLGALRSFAKNVKNWDLTVEVRAIGLYHGKTVDPATGSVVKGTGAKGQTVTTGPAVGKEGLKTLREWGITVRPLSPTDPTIRTELAKLSPADQKEIVTKILDWNTKLSDAIADVNTVPIKLVAI
ncbi:hypothetical protein, partial [Micromonospora polyrhachis]